MKASGRNKILALFFMALTIIFIVTSMTNDTFFEWAFVRHQNKWSWYLRPIFLIPFCYYSYKRNLAGISFTIFCIFTSMFWFNKPENVADDVKSFLQFEKDWLYGDWDYKKLLLITSVPVSFLALGLAFWYRSLAIGLSVITLIATGKIVWSIYNAGEAGKSIILPAVLGLLICSGLVVYGFKKLENKKSANKIRD